MKNLLTVILLSIIIIFISCKSEYNDTLLEKSKLYTYDTTSFKTEPITDTSKFVLSYNFKKDKKYIYRLISKTETTQKIIADTTITNNINQEIIYLVDFQPKTIEENGTFEAEVKVIGVLLKANVNDEKIIFDAEKEKDTLQIKRFAEFYSLLNNPFSVRFSKHGDIEEIFRVDKISNRYLNLKDADTVDIQTKTMVKEEISNNILRPLMGQILRKVTDKNLSKDSTWESAQPMLPLMVFQIKYSNSYKVSSIEKFNDDKLAVIDAGIKYTVEGKDQLTEQGLTYKFKKPVTKGEGKIYFNLSKGLIQKSKTTSVTSFSFTMEGDTPMGKQKGKREDSVTNTYILDLIK